MSTTQTELEPRPTSILVGLLADLRDALGVAVLLAGIYGLCFVFGM